MAYFKGSLYEDKFTEPAELLYKNTLYRKVGQQATHSHGGTLHWTSYSTMKCEAPHIQETYDWIFRVLGMEVYLAWISKLTYTPFNASLFVYSINFSAYRYINASIITVNYGKFFILPSNNRYQYGRLQINIRPVQNTNGKKTARDLAERGEKKNGVIYIRDVREEKNE